MKKVVSINLQETSKSFTVRVTEITKNFFIRNLGTKNVSFLQIFFLNFVDSEDLFTKKYRSYGHRFLT